MARPDLEHPARQVSVPMLIAGIVVAAVAMAYWQSRQNASPSGDLTQLGDAGGSAAISPYYDQDDEQ